MDATWISDILFAEKAMTMIESKRENDYSAVRWGGYLEQPMLRGCWALFLELINRSTSEVAAAPALNLHHLPNLAYATYLPTWYAYTCDA